jgi:hypothetical protein
MRRWCLVVLLAACDDDQGGTEPVADLDASVTIACTTGPDAATALGVRGVELWEAFEGTYTLPANRLAGKNKFQDATFTLTVARSAEKAPGLDDCARVAVPVLISLQGMNPALNESIVGVLRGSLLSADIAFATPEYLQSQEPRVYGSLAFNRGQLPQLKLRTDDDATWIAPPLPEAP